MSQLALWNDYMKSYDLLNEIGAYRQSQADILRRARPGPAVRVLDAGSGTGNLSVALKQAGAHVVSCDFSSSAILVHRAKDPQAETHQLSLEDPLPFESQSFDSVCCASVLFALSRKGCENAVAEFQRVLKSGGRAVITVPSRLASVRHLLKLYLNSCVERYGMLRGVGHGLHCIPALWKIADCNARLMRMPDWEGVHFFEADELTTLLRNAGFAKVEIESTYGGGFLLATSEKA